MFLKMTIYSTLVTLHRLSDFAMIVQCSKCKIGKSDIQFLSHQLSEGWYLCLENKLQKIETSVHPSP